MNNEQIVENLTHKALVAYKEPDFARWAKRWLDGTDRSAEAAEVMYEAVYDRTQAALYKVAPFEVNYPYMDASSKAVCAIDTASRFARGTL